MSFRKLIIILTIVITSLVVVLLGTSYAWYSVSNAVTSFSNVQTFNEDLSLSVVFTNSANISTEVGVPISSSNVATKSEKSTFTITPSSQAIGSRTAAYQISLENVSIDSALTAVSSLKYSLLETVNNVTTTVASGNFNNFTGTSLVLKTMTTISTFDIPYSYEFRLWLEDDGTDQSSLMNKNISGVIKVSTAIR